MTAIDIFIRGGAVHMLTDGAFYDPDGIILSEQQKPFILAPLNLVMAARGQSFWLPVIGHQINETHRTFDDAVRGLPEMMCLCRGFLAKQDRYRPLLDDPLELFAVGFSEERARPEAWVIVNHGGHGLPVMKPILELDSIVTPMDDRLLARLGAASIDLGPSFDPATDGLNLLRLQKANGFLTPTGARVRGVGGFAQLTSVYPDRIETRILERWPTRVRDGFEEASNDG